jgi:predicted lipoprotein with Yx(FWY)xxD motif
MQATIVVGRLVAVAALVAAVTFGNPARGDTLKVARSEKAGAYLTDGKGMTLYTFKKDTPGKSVCAAECVTAWPLYYGEKISAPAELKPGDFGSITREDGKKQTTYKGLPLYYFFKDEKPGDTNGHGVKEVWFVAAP